jgi:hypothetical protein
MNNKRTMDKEGLKNLLKLYNRYIFSIVNLNDGRGLTEDIITDKELDFLINLYQEIACKQQITTVE